MATEVSIKPIFICFHKRKYNQAKCSKACFLMGAGGSTSSRPGSATVLVTSRRPSSDDLPSRSGSAHARSSHHDCSDRPTGSCCSHFRKNHAAVTRTVTPAEDSSPPADDSIDDDIEEIVANTLDLASNNKPHRTDSRDSGRDTFVHNRVDTDSARRDFELRGSGVELRRTIRSSSRVVQKRPSDEIEEQEEAQYDAKGNLPEVDFAKFKKVNHKGTTIAPNGRVIHHQESDLLWRLGLISPEAYKMNTGPRSAPTNQGPYLKTPSYDLTEEQLMANIEKEFEVTI